MRLPVNAAALLLALLGCQSDYGVNPGGGSSEGGSSDPSCESPSLPGYPTDVAECLGESGTFDPVLEYFHGTWSTSPDSKNVMMTPAVGSLSDDNGDGRIDEDDIPDIVLITTSGLDYGVLRVLSGDGSGELLSVEAQLQWQGGVALGDIDSDGIQEIVAPTGSRLQAFEHTGVLKWTSPSLSGYIVGAADHPSIADLDGDGAVEIIVGAAVLNGSDGSVRALGEHAASRGGDAGSTSFAADLDGDGLQEVITGNTVFTADGETLWHNDFEDGYVAAADFDGDGQGEIVVTRDGQARLQDGDGSVIWEVVIDEDGASGPPCVADFDGDGEAEIGVSGEHHYTLLDTDGSVLWQRSISDGASGTSGSTAFDFDGDGSAEVVYADERTLWVFDGEDGAVELEYTDHGSGTWMEHPVVVDVDNDGQAEILLVHNGGEFAGISVIGDSGNWWGEALTIWNQYAFNITNINSDGSIPAAPETSWEVHNSFRASTGERAAQEQAPELQLELGDFCEEECAQGRLRAWVHPGNLGVVDGAAGAELVAYAKLGTDSIEVARVPVTQALPAGEFLAAIEVVIEASSFEGWSAVEIFVESNEPDCNNSNNGVRIGGAFCE